MDNAAGVTSGSVIRERRSPVGVLDPQRLPVWRQLETICSAIRPSINRLKESVRVPFEANLSTRRIYDPPNSPAGILLDLGRPSFGADHSDAKPM